MNYMIIIFKKSGDKRYVGLFTDRVAAILWARENVKEGDRFEATPIHLLPTE